MITIVWYNSLVLRICIGHNIKSCFILYSGSLLKLEVFVHCLYFFTCRLLALLSVLKILGDFSIWSPKVLTTLREAGNHFLHPLAAELSIWQEASHRPPSNYVQVGFQKGRPMYIVQSKQFYHSYATVQYGFLDIFQISLTWDVFEGCSHVTLVTCQFVLGALW